MIVVWLGWLAVEGCAISKIVAVDTSSSAIIIWAETSVNWTLRRFRSVNIRLLCLLKLQVLSIIIDHKILIVWCW